MGYRLLAMIIVSCVMCLYRIAALHRICLPMQDELLAVKAGLEQRQLACVTILLPHGASMQKTTKQARSIQHPSCIAHGAFQLLYLMPQNLLHA